MYIYFFLSLYTYVDLYIYILVDRGGCDFVTKARNVQTAGAVAMVVANNQMGIYIYKSTYVYKERKKYIYIYISG